MPIPDLRSLTLTNGITLEAGLEAHRLVFWRRDGVGDGFEHWERIASVARGAVWTEAGIAATAATAVRTRRRVAGVLGKLLSWGRRSGSEKKWVLPSGEDAEQCGAMETDLILAWPEDAARSLDEAGVRQVWPGAPQVTMVAANLFVVRGVKSPEKQQSPVAARDDAPSVPLPPAGEPRAVAEEWLAAARLTGDRAKEAAALTELGILTLRDGDRPRAYGLLEAAWALVQELGDAKKASDVRDNLGLAALAVGDARRAQELFTEELAWARRESDVFAEKSVLARLGLVAAAERDAERARSYYGQALALARQLNDQHQEVLLLWDLAIQHAEVGLRDEAIAHARAAVDLLRQMGKPEAGWFAEHLAKFQAGARAVSPPDSLRLPTTVANQGEVITAIPWVASAIASATDTPARGPGLLRMATTATQALAKFIGSGGQTVVVEVFQQRLRTCMVCEHHTGVRCRLCGCFTNVKARLPHERCPTSKW